MDFCNNPGSATLPTELTVGDRTYDMFAFIGEGQASVFGWSMAVRAKEMLANLGEEDGQYLLDNQQDIPAALREKVVFVFTDWCFPRSPEDVCCVRWRDGRWIQIGRRLGYSWDTSHQVLRRK